MDNPSYYFQYTVICNKLSTCARDKAKQAVDFNYRHSIWFIFTKKNTLMVHSRALSKTSHCKHFSYFQPEINAFPFIIYIYMYIYIYQKTITITIIMHYDLNNSNSIYFNMRLQLWILTFSCFLLTSQNHPASTSIIQTRLVCSYRF